MGTVDPPASRGLHKINQRFDTFSVGVNAPRGSALKDVQTSLENHRLKILVLARPSPFLFKPKGFGHDALLRSLKNINQR